MEEIGERCPNRRVRRFSLLRLGTRAINSPPFRSLVSVCFFRNFRSFRFVSLSTIQRDRLSTNRLRGPSRHLQWNHFPYPGLNFLQTQENDTIYYISCTVSHHLFIVVI